MSFLVGIIKHLFTNFNILFYQLFNSYLMLSEENLFIKFAIPYLPIIYRYIANINFN